LLDAFIPGVGDTTDLFLLKDLWHFHFYGPTPLALVAGRERIYFEHFWNDFAADGKKSVSEADRQFYASKYAEPGAMKAGMEVFRAFDQDAKDNARFSATKLAMPMLVLGGEKSGGDFLISQDAMVADKVEAVLVTGSGHWLMDEAPDQGDPAARCVFPVGTAQSSIRTGSGRAFPALMAWCVRRSSSGGDRTRSTPRSFARTSARWSRESVASLRPSPVPARNGRCGR
jgi:hypothetical protein